MRTRVGLVDQSSGGKLYLLGPDAERAAQWLFSAHIPAESGALLCCCNAHISTVLYNAITITVRVSLGSTVCRAGRSAAAYVLDEQTGRIDADVAVHSIGRSRGSLEEHVLSLSGSSLLPSAAYMPPLTLTSRAHT